MATQPVKGVVRQVKPLLSRDLEESRKRVISLYKAWYRMIPETIIWYSLPIGISRARALLKNEFIKHKDLRDLRVIDMLVVKGQMELKETAMRWKQTSHVMFLAKGSQASKKPTSFLAKFLKGSE